MVGALGLGLWEHLRSPVCCDQAKLKVLISRSVEILNPMPRSLWITAKRPNGKLLESLCKPLQSPCFHVYYVDILFSLRRSTKRWPLNVKVFVNIWAFPTIRGTLFWGPSNRDPTICGTIVGSPNFRKPPSSYSESRRKSVIFHLRELAKASVIAKFLAARIRV